MKIQFFMRLKAALNIDGPVTFVTNIRQTHNDNNKEQLIKKPTQSRIFKCKHKFPKISIDLELH
jgi:hypothetical protein